VGVALSKGHVAITGIDSEEIVILDKVVEP
jgi:hypothetical protein